MRGGVIGGDTTSHTHTHTTRVHKHKQMPPCKHTSPALPAQGCGLALAAGTGLSMG